MVELIRGPSDCKKSHFSAFEIEQHVYDIDGVLDVSDEDGGGLEFAEHVVVTVDEQYRGKPQEEAIRTGVERILGPNVKYHFEKREML